MIASNHLSKCFPTNPSLTLHRTVIQRRPQAPRMMPFHHRLRCLLLFFITTTTSSATFAQSFGDPSSGEASIYQRGASARVAPASTPPTVETSSSPQSETFPRLLIEGGETAAATATKAGKNQFAAPLVTVTSSLAVVLGLFAVLVWVSRKYGSKTMGGSIPSEVIQTLGSTAIDPRTRITMIRLGNRILVLAQSASGIEPISEITDPDEVRNLTALCVGDSKAQFSSTLQSIEHEPAQAGFVGQQSSQPVTAPKPRHRGSLFTTA